MKKIEIAETERGFRVSRDCKTQAEAIACGNALMTVPPSQAYQPVLSVPDTPDETDLPEHAFRDADDNVAGLSAGTAS